MSHTFGVRSLSLLSVRGEGEQGRPATFDSPLWGEDSKASFFLYILLHCRLMLRATGEWTLTRPR